MAIIPKHTVTLKKIDKLFGELKKLKPLSTSELREYKKSLLVHATYHSNALEGNTLTLSETKLIIEDGLTIGGKTVREIRETTNHVEAFKILEKLVKKASFTEKDLLLLHKEILAGIDDENAGKYRKKQVWISGDEVLPPPAIEVPKKMKKHFADLEATQKMHPVLLAAKFHYDCAKIHPFIDGNGRVMRLAINVLLMQHGFSHVIFPIIRRVEYIQSLHSSKKFEDFLDFFCDVVHQNMQDFKRMIS